LALFRRSKPLHQQLADVGGLELDGGERPQGLAAAPPGWDGEQRGEPGIHGVSRARRWDTVVTTSAPELHGDAVRFVALPDGRLLADGGAPDGALAPLAAAVASSLAVPYRAEAVHRGGDVWAVAARQITAVREPTLSGDEAELVVTPTERALEVDGSPQLARAAALDEAGRHLGDAFVVRANRLDGDLWEVEATAL
jgi:hypothetical protein